MRRLLIVLAGLAVVAMGAHGVRAGEHCGTTNGTTAQPGRAACATAQGSAPHGKVAGRFDPAVSGVCRFACATKLKYQANEVLAQPGAKAGKLTQCPVSGVVFAVDAGRPRVRIGKNDYVTCCDKCAQKLKRNPRRYLDV